jgi:hypothetical protein
MHQVSKIFCFVTELYMFRASSLPITGSYQLYTWQLICFVEVMWPLPRVQLITPDDGHRRCPKHVEFRDKIKNFVYLVHLVGYLYEDYHDARSLEHKVC